MATGDKLVTLAALKEVNDRVKPIEEGGTNANNAPSARTNLSVYSKAEVNSLVEQSTADKAKTIFFNVSSWDDIYNKLSALSGGETAAMFISTSVVSLMTGGAVSSGGLTGFVGPTNTIAGRYTFFAAHYGTNNNFMWEINGLTAATSTPSVIGLKKFEPDYTSGMTEDFGNNAVAMTGFVTTGRTLMTFFIDLPKSLKSVSRVSCTRLSGVIRGNDGYVNNVSSNTDWVGMTGITVTPVIVYENKLRINITSNTELTNTTNNTPLFLIGYCTFAMS